MMPYYVGLDISQELTAICIVDEEGTIKYEDMVPTEPDDIITYLNSTGEEYGRVGMETGSFSHWLYHALHDAGLPIVCMDARHAHAVMKAQIAKTDKNDARGLAQMMRTGWFKATHVKSAESQKIRVLLNNRSCLNSKRIDIENQIRGTLKVFGLKTGKVTKVQYESRIREMIENDPELQSYIEPLLHSRQVMVSQVLVLEKQIRRMAKNDDVCRRLMTIPGVGPIIALLYKATVDNPYRFTRSNTLGVHLGLTPRKYASGEIDYDGHITKCGDTALRTHLFEAAKVLISRSGRWSTLKAWGLQVAKRSSMKNACVAVARKLAVLMHRMWVDGSEFRYGVEPATP
ncbi:MAG: IS110 family transposase [Deltaproteobacteria bacterium]|nr:IS110 family transposase [Deltaproteobacteria bacterium]